MAGQGRSHFVTLSSSRGSITLPRAGLKFQQTERFAGDCRRLSDEEFRQFWQVVRDELVPAAERHVSRSGSSWPAGLRIKPVGCPRGVGDDLELRRA